LLTAKPTAEPDAGFLDGFPGIACGIIETTVSRLGQTSPLWCLETVDSLDVIDGSAGSMVTCHHIQLRTIIMLLVWN
jgi:hypothetical protein